MARRETRQRLRINRESLATRCDICHQSDNYDPRNNRCSRCEDRTEIDLMEGSLSLENNSFIVEQPTENNSLNLTSDNTNAQQQPNATARPEPFNDGDSALDQREVLFNERLPELQDTETTMDEEDLEYRLPRTDTRTSTGFANNLIVNQGISLRLVGAVVFLVVACLIIFASGNYNSNSSTSTLKNKLEPTPTLESNRNANDALDTQAETETETQASDEEEIPFKLEIDSNPEKITENPVVVLGVGNVTTLEIDQIAKDIIIGDKEALEVIKSSSNPRKLYLIGKAPISNGNVVIESTNQTITLFYEVIENATVGGFNGQIKIISSK